MRYELRSGCTGFGRKIFADDLRQVVNRSQIPGLAVRQIAVQSRRQFEAPPLLNGIGNPYRYPLFDAWDVEQPALQNNLDAARARIERAPGVALCAGPGVVSGVAGDARRGTITVSEQGSWSDGRSHCTHKIQP